ncbi:MAG TPA: MBL fold metallo-hydrolase, partial [Polyangiales bacterium]|nr:MBL fold metallo-hydrolase [Polyangiales bacterium]
ASGEAVSDAVEIADGVFAYLQRGSWGYSNGGLIAGPDGSLLVDTMYDLALTRQMLDTLHSVNAAPIATVVNTHANGDHCWGNQLVNDAEIISTRAAAAEMLELSPRLMATLVQASRAIVRGGALASWPLRLLGRIGVTRAGLLAEAAPLLAERFGGFDFGPITLRPPDRTFEGALTLQLGELEVQLLELGPAHTRGDAVVYLPKHKVLFSGDLLFTDSHPIVWDGPIQNWIDACDRILALEVDVIVPGHGPLTDKAGVRRTKEYWRRVLELAHRIHTKQLSLEHALSRLRHEFDWREPERAVVNLSNALRQLGERVPTDPLALLAMMAQHR